VGVSYVGAESSEAVWEIRKIDERDVDPNFVDTTLIVTTAAPDQVWDDRLIITYK